MGCMFLPNNGKPPTRLRQLHSINVCYLIHWQSTSYNHVIVFSLTTISVGKIRGNAILFSCIWHAVKSHCFAYMHYSKPATVQIMWLHIHTFWKTNDKKAYLRTHARIPTAVMALPQYNVPHTCYWKKHLLAHGWSPIQWIAVHIHIRIDKWPQRHSFLLHSFSGPLSVTAQKKRNNWLHENTVSSYITEHLTVQL
jgi:hypothetical protein